GPEMVGHVTCSPDDKRLAFLRIPPSSKKCQVFVSDVNGANLRQLTFSDTSNVYYPAWSPDGKQIAFESAAPGGLRALTVVSVDEGTTREVFRGHTPKDRFFDISWSPDGSKIGWTTDSEIRIGQVSNGKYHTFKVDMDADVLGGPRWSPDGTRILFYTWSRVTQLMIMDNFLPQAKEGK
ncbi:MAG: TolB family protein, partial [bacterium]